MTQQISSEGMGFVAFPLWALTSLELSLAERSVLLALGSYADSGGDCHPSRQTLAERADVSVRTLDRCINALIGHGLVEKIARVDEDGRQHSNSYRLINRGMGAGKQRTPSPGRETQTTRGGVSDVSRGETPETPIELEPWELKKPPPYPPQLRLVETPPPQTARHVSLEDRPRPPGSRPRPSPIQRPAAEPTVTMGPTFDDFWDAYPRKVSRAAAKRAWKKATRTTDGDIILTALRNNPPTASEPKYLPHPSTWLNNERWLDEPPAAPLAGNLDRADVLRRASELGWEDTALISMPIETITEIVRGNLSPPNPPDPPRNVPVAAIEAIPAPSPMDSPPRPPTASEGLPEPPEIPHDEWEQP